MARVSFEDIAHSYAGGDADESSFALKPMTHYWQDGGAYALLGPSGCGKTTLLNVMSGLVVPTRGRVRFDDRDVTTLPTEQRNIAQVFQFPVIYDTMTVYDNLAFPLRNRRVPAADVDQRVRAVAEMLDLSGDLQRRARGLTADAKQKISLGRGLVRSDVAAILFDEPLTVIDPHMEWQLRRKLKEIHEQFKLTLVHVTHDQNEALTFAEQVVVMHDGRILQVGSPQELFERPTHTFVGYFIGSPGMNVLPAQIDGTSAIVNGHEIPMGRSFGDLAVGETAIGFRPEFAKLSSGEEGLPVRILRVEDVGRHKIIRAEFEGIEVNAVLPEDAEIAADMTRITFDAAAAHVYRDGWIVDSDARKAQGAGG